MASTESVPPASPAPFSAPAIARRLGIHYGWVMVGITFLLVTVTAGIRSAPGVMITPLKDDFGWSTAQISWAISLSILTLGLAGPVSGRLIDRHGIRPVIIGFLVLGTSGVFATWLVQSLWQFYASWGVLVGFGAGGTSIVLSATVANTWFQERRGLVTGILGGAASAGQLVFVLLLALIVDAWGWRSAVGLMAIIAGAVVLPSTVIFLRSRPRDVGLAAYGVLPGEKALASDERLVPMKEAIRTGDFWLIALSFGVCGFTTIGLIGTHFIPHATEHGFSEKQAAGMLSVIGGFNVVGTIASGWLTDRYSPRKLLALYYFLRGCSLLVLPALSGSGIPLMSMFAVVFGLDYIATVPPTVMLTANRFGRRSVGTIYGWITFSHMVGGAIAAALAGVIHDAAGDYGPAMYAGGILALFAAAFAFQIGTRRPKPPGLRPATSY
ncbi:MAG: MFS transporter [Dehalococcoidia bacterium]|uniref:MFS transporter n=1 Tax=Candidatus Amarobacter glycogenicus TaxID=3140699 RepID=UPI00313574AE|nr:MFS transporter [Dehalococcoidia bacterium]